MNTKTALITGGTSGIGLSIVQYLAKLNFNVYFIGTNISKGLNIERKVSTWAKGVINFINLDLSDLRAVQHFSEDFLNKHQRLDLLANIAGVLLPKRETNHEGIEKSFAISYLSSYILSTGLEPLLKNAPESKIINVGAAPKLVLNEIIDFNALNSDQNYNGFKTSGLAVHAKTVLTQILSDKHVNSNISVSSFDPGMVRSDLLRNMPLLPRLLSQLFFLFAPKNSSTAIRACTSFKPDNQNGMLITKKKPIQIQFSKEYQEKLIQLTKEILSPLANK